jgi:hypothetical protein
MSTVEDLPRWFELSDGTLSYKANVYECLNFTQTYETLGGFSTIRMLNGTAVKQNQWQKLKTTLSGGGLVPVGLADLDFRLPITIKCGVPRAITRPTNSFSLVAPHRTDTGYAPVVFKLVDGYWVSLAASGTAIKYMQLYYPLLTCLASPPQESYNWDGVTPSSWTLTAEEI